MESTSVPLAGDILGKDALKLFTVSDFIVFRVVSLQNLYLDGIELPEDLLLGPKGDEAVGLLNPNRIGEGVGTSGIDGTVVVPSRKDKDDRDMVSAVVTKTRKVIFWKQGPRNRINRTVVGNTDSVEGFRGTSAGIKEKARTDAL